MHLADAIRILKHDGGCVGRGRGGAEGRSEGICGASQMASSSGGESARKHMHQPAKGALHDR